VAEAAVSALRKRNADPNVTLTNPERAKMKKLQDKAVKESTAKSVLRERNADPTITLTETEEEKMNKL